MNHESPDGRDAISIEQTVDKYDYMIIFTIPEVQRSGIEQSEERITWKEMEQVWLQCTPGDDDARQAAVEHLKEQWKKRVTPVPPKDTDSIPVSSWLSIARHAIIDALSTQTDLQIKVTKFRTKALCRIRAPLASLEREAAALGYKLEFRNEVDPGMEFWAHDEEIEEEQGELDLDEANETLERLWNHKKISANDLAVFESERMPKHWSRRIHTLERIADQVPVSNHYPAFAPFSTERRVRHLFKVYPSIRGRTLFRSKDRLILTKSIINSILTMEVLESREVIDSLIPLHDANRGDRLTRDVLLRRWVFFWRSDASHVGAPMITHPAMVPGELAPWYLRPFSQPLPDVREYFGEQVALYFSWLGYYAYALVLPALLGLADEVYLLWSGDPSSEEGLHWTQAGMAIIIILWTIVYKEGWDREEKAISCKWGTQGFEEEEEDRPQFEGDAEEPRQRSRVTNRMETFYPEWKRSVKQAISLAIVLLTVVAQLVLVDAVFDLEYTLEVERGYSWGSAACNAISAVQIVILSGIYREWIAKPLNEWENYQTDTAYDDNLILKTFIFQMSNNYAALLFSAFLKDWLYECSGENCMDDVRELLVFIFAIRFLINLWLLVKPLFADSASEAAASEKKKDDDLDSKKEEEDEEDADTARLLGDEEILPYVEEMFLEPYDGTFDDYAEIVLQYGYVVMFCIALPAVATLAIIENLIQIRLDGYTLCTEVRRPAPSLAEDVGMWGKLMDALSILAILVNVGLIVFTTASYESYSLEDKFLLFLMAEQGVILVKVVLHILIPDEPEWLADVQARNAFVVTKYYYGGDEAGAEQVKEKKGGYLEMDIDVDGASLDDFKSQDLQISKEDAEELQVLEARKRELRRELNIANTQLRNVSQTEEFDEVTQIGRTKHGLPLGVLHIKILEMEDFETQRPENIKVLVSLRSTKSGDRTPPGPSAEMSRGAFRASNREEGALAFNQVFTMAPVRTQDAEVVFEVMEAVLSEGMRRRGTAKVHLRELADQEEKSRTLTVEVRAPDGSKAHSARLYIKIKFNYSKIVPLRTKIFRINEELRTVEKEYMNRKTGRK